MLAALQNQTAVVAAPSPPPPQHHYNEPWSSSSSSSSALVGSNHHHHHHDNNNDNESFLISIPETPSPHHHHYHHHQTQPQQRLGGKEASSLLSASSLFHTTPASSSSSSSLLLEKQHHNHNNTVVGSFLGLSRAGSVALADAATLRIGGLLLLWYACSILSNNSSKSILDLYPSASTLSLVQFAFMACYCQLLMRVFHVFPYRRLSFSQLLRQVSPISVGHILGMVLTHISLELVPVSFTQTVKATSPVTAVILSRVVLHETFSWDELLSLVPIVAGVIMCTLTEINFELMGLLTAFGSTLLFSYQNIYSKKLFREQSIDHINLLSNVSIVSFVLLLPFWLVERWGWLSLWSPLSSEDLQRVVALYLVNGLTHFGQTLFAFILLSRISPLTYSVASTLKRVFVILTSLLWFGNTISPLNAFGIALALFGMMLYNQAKHAQRSKKHSNLSSSSTSPSVPSSASLPTTLP